MTNKMKLYTGLLVLGLAMVGAGLWFLLKPATVETFSMAVSPPPGNYLLNSQNVSSQILLKNVQIEQTVSDKEYFQSSPKNTIKPGDPILSVALTITNNHPTYKIIGISAVGYDASGVQVAHTLDDVVHRMARTQLGYQETGNITVHMNFTNNVKLIKLFGNTFQYPPP